MNDYRTYRGACHCARSRSNAGEVARHTWRTSVGMGVPDASTGKAYGPLTDDADLPAFDWASWHEENGTPLFALQGLRCASP